MRILDGMGYYLPDGLSAADFDRAMDLDDEPECEEIGDDIAECAQNGCALCRMIVDRKLAEYERDRALGIS